MKTPASKRFRDPWWINLSPQAKLVLDYVAENCDAAGVIQFNPTEWEYVLGFYKQPERWVDGENEGVTCKTKTIASDQNALFGGLGDQIRRLPCCDWTALLAEINTPPQEMALENVVPQIEMVGEAKWWYVRAVERKWGELRPVVSIEGESTGQSCLNIVLMEEKAAQKKTVKLLRKHGLIEKLKAYYGDQLTIHQTPSAEEATIALNLAEGGIDDVIPDLQKALKSKEGRGLMEEQIKVWYFSQEQVEFAGCKARGWRNSLKQYADEQQIRNDFAKTFPEGLWELEWAEDKIIETNQDRQPSANGPVLTDRARALIALLQAAQKIIQLEAHRATV